MSIFGKIRDAIFGHHEAAAQANAPAQTPQAAPAQQSAPQPAAPTAPAAPVDVEAVLTGIAQKKGNPNLDYHHSIVDLMKLLDLDPSLDNRKQLATELGYTGARDGSAEMNIWLHQRVIEELKKSGGQVSDALKA